MWGQANIRTQAQIPLPSPGWEDGGLPPRPRPPSVIHSANKSPKGHPLSVALPYPPDHNPELGCTLAVTARSLPHGLSLAPTRVSRTLCHLSRNRQSWSEGPGTLQDTWIQSDPSDKGVSQSLSDSILMLLWVQVSLKIALKALTTDSHQFICGKFIRLTRKCAAFLLHMGILWLQSHHMDLLCLLFLPHFCLGFLQKHQNGFQKLELSYSYNRLC